MNFFTFRAAIIAFFFTCCWALHAQQTSFFSYGPEGTQTFILDTTHILVGFQADQDETERNALVRSVSTQLTYDPNLEFPRMHATVLQVQPGVTQAQIQNMLLEMNGRAGISYASPFLLYQNGCRQGILDQINIGLRNAGDYSWLVNTCKQKGLGLPVRNEFDPLIYAVKVPDNRMGRALEIANNLFQTGQVAFSEVNFLLITEPHTNDPYHNTQWSQENNGQYWNGNTWINVGVPDADMDIQGAWGITAGNSGIKVAVIDEGVDLNHPDLVGNLLTGYDATGGGSAGGAANNDSHGTACAGIIAAKANNGIGLAGNAYNCKIIPVRIAYTPIGQTQWFTTPQIQANGINWAWQTGGASVLSNSWGGGSYSSIVNTAILNAVTSGRGGKGSPVLFSSGNGNTGTVSFPASNVNAIAVGASSMCDTRKSFVSCDGENTWGSNYGTGIDVVAPGVKITTTDIAGAAGSTSGDYSLTFNGTSAACPNAASVIALILSVNPDLTASQARQILENSCQRVGGYTYSTNSSQPNGTWNSEMGYGRVNALAACQAAQGVSCSAPSSAQISASNITTTSARLNCSVSGVQSYDWKYRKVGVSAWTDLTNGTNNYIDISGLTTNTQYEFSVSVRCNASLWSTWSAVKTFTTSNTAACNAPSASQLSATNVTTTSVRLNCSVSGVQAFDWRYRKSGVSSWTDLPGGTSNYYDVTGLTANTAYEFSVSVRCDASTWSAWSASKAFSTSAPAACNAPSTSQISATNITTSAARLNCSVSGVQAYDWVYRKVGNTSWIELSGGSPASIDISGLNSNTQYEFCVAVRCDASTWSSWSSAKSFTTSTASLPNDNPCGAIQITASSSCSNTSGSNTGATPTYSGSNCGTSSPVDVWFKCAIPSSEHVTFRTTAGSLSDAVMAVYWGSCSSLTYITCEDDNSNGNGSAMPVIGITGQAGTMLWIRVWGYANSTGSFSICALNYNSANFTGNGNEEPGGTVFTLDQIQLDSNSPAEVMATPTGFNSNELVSDDRSANTDKMNTQTGNIFPNPATEQATLAYTLAAPGTVQITVCDLLGKVVQSQTAEQESGDYQVDIDVRTLAIGAYWVRFQSGSMVKVQQLQVAR